MKKRIITRTQVHDKTAEEMRAALAHNGVPEHLWSGLIDYLFGGHLPGSFLCCVLENDFSGAVMRADPVCIHALKPLVDFLNMEVPSDAHGSPEKVKAYVNSFIEP